MPKTLLLADDSVVIQKLVGLSFANEDVELVTTDNGDDAITRAHEVSPDLVLADVVMPGKNGYEVCAAIKSDPKLAGIPVLLLTGTFEAFDEERARQVGSDGHITKPFEAQGLVDRVTELLARGNQGAAPVGQPAAPQATSPAAAVAPDVAATPPAPPADDAFDFFDDDTQHDASAVTPPAAGGSPSPGPLGHDPLSSLAGDPLAGDSLGGSGKLDGDFDLEPTAPDDRTVVTMSPGPAAGGPPPLSDDLGATRVALDGNMLADDSMGGAPDPLTPLAQPQPAALESDPILGDDLFADMPAPEVAAPPSPPAMDVPVTTVESQPATPRVGLASQAAPTGSPAEELQAAFDHGAEHPGTLLSESEPAEARTVVAMDASPLAPQTPEPPRMDPMTVGADPAAAAMPPPQKSAYDVSISDLGDPLAGEAMPSPDLATVAPRSMPGDVPPAVRDRIHETLEKVAWDAFADLSDTIVRKVIQRVETVVWDIVPQMAETLIQEEIRRMKGED